MTNEKTTVSTIDETNFSQLLNRLNQDADLSEKYEKLGSTQQNRLRDFLSGKTSLPLTYDPFFKFIFNPDLHRDRLSHFISSLLGMTVHVVEVLSSSNTLMDGESYLIMDLIVKAADGSIVNVEIQKQGYGFPGERMSCYAADLILRQYIKEKKTSPDKKSFSYKDIKQVYVIVIFEKSTKEMKTEHNAYLHRGEVTFDTGIKLNMLEKFCIISLDVFRKIPYSEIKKNEQAAWLFLLSMNSPEDAECLTQDFPWMESIFQEIASLRKRPEEVLSMWSEALPMLDENSLKYRVEELSEEVDNLNGTVQNLNGTVHDLNKKLEQSNKNTEKEKAAREAAEKETQAFKKENQAFKKENQAALARIKELEQLLASKK